MKGEISVAARLCRFVLTMTLLSVVTAFVFLVALPEAGKLETIGVSVGVSLLVAMYDLGLFRSEFEI